MAMWGGNYWAARDREADAKAWLETEFGTNWKAQHGLVSHPQWPDEENYMLCSRCHKHCAYHEGSKNHIQSHEHKRRVPRPLCTPVWPAAAEPVAVPPPPAEEPVAVPAPPAVVTPPPGLNSEEAAIEGLGATLADMLSLASSSSSSNSDLPAGLGEDVQFQTVVNVFLHWTPELQRHFIRRVSD